MKGAQRADKLRLRPTRPLNVQNVAGWYGLVTFMKVFASPVSSQVETWISVDPYYKKVGIPVPRQNARARYGLSFPKHDLSRVILCDRWVAWCLTQAGDTPR